MIIGVWQSFGYNVILYMSGLKQINKQLYEAAELDGAGVFQKLRKITLPALSPVTFFVVVITTLFSFRVFATVQILIKGGPGNASSVWVYYIWREAFRYFETGTASTAASLLFLCMLIITFIMVRFVQKKVFYQQEERYQGFTNQGVCPSRIFNNFLVPGSATIRLDGKHLFLLTCGSVREVSHNLPQQFRCAGV